MFTIAQLNNAFSSAASIASFQKGFDTLAWRRLFENDFQATIEEKKEILAYLKTHLPKSCPNYLRIRDAVNTQEFASDYFQSAYPRKFYGAYAPVVRKVMAGFMAMAIEQQRGA